MATRPIIIPFEQKPIERFYPAFKRVYEERYQERYGFLGRP